MDLGSLLPTIRTLPDLRHLAHALGFDPLGDEIPPDLWTGGAKLGRPVRQVVALARAGSFPWFAVETPDPAGCARALARRMVARGRAAGVLALDLQARRLAAAVGFGPVPVLEFALDAPDPTAIASLARLGAVPAGGALGYAARAADALSAERVGQRFFREFRTTLGRMAAGLPASMRAEDRHDFALLQLTRVLFLYFVQTKGWLAGRERFLAEQVDRCLSSKRRVHRDLLRPLFFGTLNCPAPERGRVAATFGAVPFLNGGLFEPHALEHRYRVDLSNEVWRDAFDRLFEAFHFTVTECDRGGAVAPDMLGRVFEGVMDPDVRRATGTFYTPAALVDRVIDAGLVALLAERLRCGDAEAERRLRECEPGAAAVLDSVTLLDPAAGSGAFLLGALERLAAIGGAPSAARKRRILQRNLFGVDRSATAVRLTELRLWLAVIADDPAERADDVAPLPNLDCLVRQGDSLFDPVRPPGGSSTDYLKLTVDLTALRVRVVTAAGPTKAALTRQLRRVELELLAASLADAEVHLCERIAACLHEARGSDLFGRQRGLDRPLRTTLEQLRTQLRETRRARRLVGAGEVPWFHYHSHFADVFARSGGFDLVVGNPPWQRAESIPPAVRRQLAGRYRWWRAGSGGYANPPDLALAFLERAFELAAPGGVVALLVPAKLASAGYGTAARHALATETTLHTIADLTSDRDAAFDATVYPLAVVAAKALPTVGHRLRTALGGRRGTSVRQADLVGGSPWVLVSDRERRALTALRAAHPRLDEWFTCHLGVKTGANALFLNPPADLEPDVLRWAVRGRDVAAFRTKQGVRLLWTHNGNGQARTTLPARAAAYLERHQTALRARADFIGGAPWTLFRVTAASARYRVIWADLARQLTAAALIGARDQDFVPLNSCYVIAADSAEHAERLAAWLNSTWIRAAARAEAPPGAGGFARFNAAVVGALPLAASALADPELSTIARAGRTGLEVQDVLDTVVARHLGLSATTQTALRMMLRVRSADRR